MTDYYLKFASESEALAALEGYEGAIDVIGEIPDVTGWHVNVRGEANEKLAAYDTAPITPYRVWA